jgi:dihydroorotate dehydrogenase (NAD+) catalytic subunit
MLASGILGISFDLFPRIIKSGAGAIVTKSIGLEPREGYSNPTVTATDAGYLNAIGLANPGAVEFSRELDHELKGNVPLIVSVFADSEDHFAELVRALDTHSFLAYELNLSCPHVKQVGSEIGSTPEDAANVVTKARQETKKPILAKMPASIIDVKNWARAVESAGADAIVAINTIRAMRIDVDSRKPILSNKIGGLSGPAMRPIAVRCVYEAFESVEIPIVGVGGISNWRDATEFFLAGASAIQIGSAMATEYLKTFGDINLGLERYLRRNGFSSIREITGLAHN